MKYLLVAEAIGYQGAKFTGVPLIAERILLGNHARIKSNLILPKLRARRTSNPKNKELNRTQRLLGFTEPTSTIIWEEILQSDISPYQVLTWNIFPFHPFNNDKGSLTNRPPTTEELEIGSYYMEMLLNLFQDVTIVSIGRHSEKTLNKLGIENIHVPHPANGGATNFRVAIKNMFKQEFD